MAVSYQTDIQPLFRQVDVDHMSFFCDLWNYDEVKSNAQDILARLNGTDGSVMPPAENGGPWPEDKIALFRQWIDDGCPP